MIWYLWLLFLCISVVMIIFGFSSEFKWFILIGSAFLLITGLIVLFDGVDYQTGKTISFNYSCGCCNNGTFEQDYREDSCLNESVILSSQTEINKYSQIKSVDSSNNSKVAIGLYSLLIFMSLFFISYWAIKRAETSKKKFDDEED